MSRSYRLNFLPEKYAHRKGRRRSFGMAAASLLAVAGLLTAAVLHANASLRNAELRHGEITRAYVVANEKFQNACKLHEAQQKIIERAGAAAALVENVPRSNILADLTDRLPQGVSLADLNIETHPRTTPWGGTTTFELKKSALKVKQAATALTPELPASDVIVKLTGLAETDVQIARYLSELDQSPLFAEVSLLVAEPNASPGRESQTSRRFQIQLILRPGARLKPRPSQTDTTIADTED